jgi:eukaryotic-like serine/threonine-protein kinase
MDDSSLPVVPEEDATLPAGTRLGKYQVVRLLGAGGMGAVYEATHTEIGKRVAVKTLSPAVAAIPGARQRFLREAQLTSRLRHPNIVDLTDMGTEGRNAYLVMELLAGEDLSHRLERAGPMAPRELVDLMLPVCSALIAAHDAGIVHRDLKPQNIFLASGHQGVTPKVLDFGISKSSDTDASSSLTTTGSVIGTPHYLAPEQIKDARAASPASDQYSIGVIFYRCLTNTNPFEGESIFAILQAIVTEKPVPLAERRPGLPDGLTRLIARAMSPLPWERFPSMREVGRALLPFASPKARLIWEDTFTDASTPALPPEAPRESQTMPMPTPTPPPARLAAELSTAKASLSQGTLAPAVTSTARVSPPARAGRVAAGILIGVAVAVGGFLLLSRGARAPEATAPAATSTAVAPPAASPPPAVTPPAVAPAAVAPPPAAPSEAPKPPAEARATKPEEPARDEPAAAPSKPADAPARHRTSASHRGARSHPEAPAPTPTPRSFNPNGAPVID